MLPVDILLFPFPFFFSSFFLLSFPVRRRARDPFRDSTTRETEESVCPGPIGTSREERESEERGDGSGETIEGGDPEGVRENKQGTGRRWAMLIQKIADITGNAGRTKEGKEQRVENGKER